MTVVTIKENSWLARIAAKKMKAQQLAIVWGSTVHLHNTSRAAFLHNQRWLRHEVAHVKQYQQLGFWGFLASYLLKSIQYGYYNNPLEAEARSKEADPSVLEGIIIG